MFKRSADAGKKPTGNILITVFDMDTNTQLASQIINKKDLGNAVSVGGITIASEIETPKTASDSKIKEMAGDLADGVTLTGKAIVIKASHGIAGLGNFFTSIKDGIKEAGSEYDKKKIEEAKEKIKKVEGEGI